jgi:hypothetical protein
MIDHSFLFKVAWKSNTPNNSSLTIAAKSLQLNQIYQFMIQIINQQDSSLQFIGYLFVKIEYIQSPMIIIKYVIYIFEIKCIE